MESGNVLEEEHMSFWSGETLLDRLSQSDIITPFDKEEVDCSAYTLGIGAEYYISPSAGKKASNKSVKQLGDKESFALPPGQFAFLLTEERLCIPDDAFALISIKARYKLQGLVNVSGFHVDPGYKGHLVFGVLNVGPKSIHIRRRDRYFLIWFASLDRKTKQVRTKEGFDHIPSHLVSGIAGEFKTVEGLSKRMDGLDFRLNIFTPLAIVVFGALLTWLLRFTPAGQSGLGVAAPSPQSATASASLPPPPSPAVGRFHTP